MSCPLGVSVSGGSGDRAGREWAGSHCVVGIDAQQPYTGDRLLLAAGHNLVGEACSLELSMVSSRRGPREPDIDQLDSVEAHWDREIDSMVPTEARRGRRMYVQTNFSVCDALFDDVVRGRCSTPRINRGIRIYDGESMTATRTTT